MTVSVVIPCHNAEQDVERCLDSVFRQGITVTEVLCVNDGSSDHTAERIQNFPFPKDSSWHLIDQPNRGACAARNRGLRECTGEFVQFLDSDDVLLPGKLVHQARRLAGMPAAVILAGSYRIKGADGAEVREVLQHPGERDAWKDLVQHRLSITSPNLFHREAVLEAGGWDESLGSSQEYDLMFRMLQRGGTVVYDEHVLTEVHQRDNSISHSNLATNWVRHAHLRARVAEHLRRSGDRRDMQVFDQAVFDSIRILYQHDPAKAQELYATLLPGDFAPSISLTTGHAYLLMHRLLGFKLTERLRRLVGK